MTQQPINRLNDALMKYVFAREDQKEVTLSLINAVFAAQNLSLLEDFTFVDRELDPEFNEDRESRLDVLGRSRDGTSVNVEVQLKRFKWMEKRLLYYWARRYVLKRGRPYGDLPRTVNIVILNYEMFPALSEEYHHVFSVLNRKHIEICLSRDLEIHVIELPKFEKLRVDVTQLDSLGKWLAYLSPKTSSDELEAITMQEPMINRAIEAENVFMQDPDLVTAYEMAEKAQRDRYARDEYLLDQGRAEGWKDGRAEGWKDGRAEGWNDGWKDGRANVALNMLDGGMPLEQISKFTGLSTEEISALRKVQ